MNIKMKIRMRINNLKKMKRYNNKKIYYKFKWEMFNKMQNN